jgi:hypothetical protein
MNVYILASCRRPELIRATTLVFQTLRTGFPTWPVTVCLNRMPAWEETTVCRAATEARCALRQLKDGTPDNRLPQLFRDLLATETEPFVLCDTDMVFWDSIEGWKFEAPLAGRYIPEFFCPVTNCVTLPRLHTCLLFVDPVKTRAAIADYMEGYPKTPFNPHVDMISPMVFPLRDGDRIRGVFLDCGAVLYQAIGGTDFTPEQNAAFEHLNCGTWSDLVGDKIKLLRSVHFGIFENPRLARGLWEKQQKQYEEWKV